MFFATFTQGAVSYVIFHVIFHKLTKKQKMSYDLRVSYFPAEVIEGEWCDKQSIEPEWLRFRYRKKGENLYDGEFHLGSSGCLFYEYDVRIEYDPQTNQVWGGGENRFGIFLITGQGRIWSKLYVDAYKEGKPKLALQTGTAGLNAKRERLQLARTLRVVFKDRLWKLESAVRQGKKSLTEVRREIKNEPADLLKLFQSKLWVSRRRDVEINRRLQYQRDVTKLEEAIVDLKEKIRQEMIRIKLVTYVIPAEWKVKLGMKIEQEQLNRVLHNHSKPLFGVPFQGHEVNVEDIHWGEITDELYFDLKKRG
jgi:hypothetical protein